MIGSVTSGVRIPLFRFRCWEHAYPLYGEIAPRSHDLKHGDIHLWLKALSFGVRHRLVGNGTSLYEGCWAYKIDLVSKFGHPQEVVQSEQTCKAESWWQVARQRLKQLRLWFTHENPLWCRWKHSVEVMCVGGYRDPLLLELILDWLRR